MRGSRLFDHTDWKSKKRTSRSQIFYYSIFTENIDKVKNKKMVYTSSDVLFSTESIGEEKKRSSLFVMRSPIFSEDLGLFSLLRLY